VFQHAFTVVTTSAANAEEFRKKCIQMLESYGWRLLAAEGAGPVPEEAAFSNWSFAYPGIRAIRDSSQAFEWTGRLGKQMFEATLEADRFFLRLVFHSIRSRKISDKSGTISQAIHPL